MLSNPVEFSALQKVQNDLGMFVATEHATSREAMHRQWATPVKERVEEGTCIAGLKATVRMSPKVWRLECAANDSRFREGDFVRLSRGDPQLPFGEAIIQAISDTHVEVLIWRECGELPCNVGEKGLCLDESFFNLEERYRAAIEDLGKTAVGRDLILPLLGGAMKPKVDAGEYQDAFDGATSDGMNDRQAEAVANAVASDVCWLIHGPPGTGKTRVLAWIIADLLAKGQRILVTSFTHRAINNLLSAVAARSPDSRYIAKIGPFKDPNLPAAIEQRQSFAELSFAQHAGGYVIAATPFALRSSRLRGKDFDTVVVDEASQVTVPLAVMAMLAGRKYIFAGDHQQLPPVTASLTPEEAVKMSIFGRLEGRGFDTSLNITHRLNGELCRWPSDQFYYSELVSHSRAAGRKLVLSRCASAWQSALGASSSSAVWLAVEHHDCRTEAPEEVTLIVDLLRTLVDGGLAWKEVGVVVPFRRQARKIRQHLSGKLPERVPPAELTIDTVERMQGQERTAIIVSYTTSDVNFAERLKEFLFLPQRLNVGATRASSKLILVASPALLEFAHERAERDRGCACFASLLQSAQRIDVALPQAHV